MKNSKILITGADKLKRHELAEIMHLGCRKINLNSSVTDLGNYDVITDITIPKTTETAIFVAGHEGKRFVGIYERLIRGSQDKLSFVHIELK